jgi:hypothetical protein
VVFNGGELNIDGITIDGAIHTGIVGAVAVASIKNVTIRNVEPASDGQWGRGIYLEGIDVDSAASLENLTIEEVYDAGVFIHNLANAVIRDLTITNVHQHTDVYSDEYSAAASGAEGLVILQSDVDGDGVTVPADVTIELVGTNSLTGISRAGIIVDAAFLKMDSLAGLDAVDTRDGVSVFSQNYGVIEVYDDGSIGAETPSIGIGTCVSDGENLEVNTDGFDFSAGL